MDLGAFSARVSVPGHRVAIRPAEIEDASPIAILVSQLGYPSSPDEVQARLASILADGDYATFVAEAAHYERQGYSLTGVRLVKQLV